MGIIHQVFSTEYSACGAILIDADFTGTVTGERMRAVYPLRDGDDFGSAPMFRKWIKENAPFILPYSPHSQTPDQLRASFPMLSARQFWLAASEIGITEDSLVESLSDPEDPLYISDPLERDRAIIEIRKAGSFERLHPMLVYSAGLKGITPEELDALWLWASNTSQE